MTKENSDELSRWVKERNSTKRDVNVVAFLVVRDEARSALEAGHAAKTVWTYLHESRRIDFCYDTFLRYVKRFIRNEGNATLPPVKHKKADPRSKPMSAQGTPRPPTVTPLATTGFTYNPTPNKEELL